MSTPSTRRRYTTVHDKAALRLHPDGTRASSHSKRTAQITNDIRGNVIAADSCGPARAKQRRRRQAVNQDDPDAETFDLDAIHSHDGSDEEQEEAQETNKSKGKGKGRAGPSQYNDNEEDPPNKKRRYSKAARRRDFENDYSFLNPPPSFLRGRSSLDAQEGDVDHTANANAIPSPDLLKAIHYFASSYYDEMGQLYDATRATRMEDRRKKRLRRVSGQSQLAASSSTAENQEDPESEDDDEERVPEKQVQGDDGNEGGRGRKRGRKEEESLKARDMYKAFDGTALIAIGMLVERFVQDAVRTQVPDEWEHQMLASERKTKRRTSSASKRAPSEDAKQQRESGDEIEEGDARETAGVGSGEDDERESRDI